MSKKAKNATGKAGSVELSENQLDQAQGGGASCDYFLKIKGVEGESASTRKPSGDGRIDIRVGGAD